MQDSLVGTGSCRQRGSAGRSGGNGQRGSAGRSGRKERLGYEPWSPQKVWSQKRTTEVEGQGEVAQHGHLYS